MKSILLLSLSPHPFVLIPLRLTGPPGPWSRSSAEKGNWEQLLPGRMGMGMQPVWSESQRVGASVSSWA